MLFSEIAWVSSSSQIVLPVILSIHWWFLPKPVVLWWVQNNVTLLEVKYLILGTISCKSSVTRNSTYYKAIKNWPATWATQVRSLGQEDPLEKGMATRSSILAWRIPWTEEPGGLQSLGAHKELDITERLTLPLIEGLNYVNTCKVLQTRPGMS